METSIALSLVSFCLSALYALRYLVERRSHRWKAQMSIALLIVSFLFLALFQGWISRLRIERAVTIGTCTMYPRPGGAHETICE